MSLLSIVIPVYNEADNIQPLNEALLLYCKNEYEIILVDDGSTDETFSLIEKLSSKDNHYKCISLSRNFGHQHALMAGLEHASGDQIIMMDGDLQHPPSLIPVLLAATFPTAAPTGAITILTRARCPTCITPNWVTRVFTTLSG